VEFREPGEQQRYICKDERDEGGGPLPTAALFVLRPDDYEAQKLVGKMAESYRVAVSDENVEEPSNLEILWDYLKLAVVDILVPAGDGNYKQAGFVKFDDDGRMSDYSLNCIPMRYRLEIANEYVGEHSLSEPERKNSE
jgi:hypothetical protein